MSKEGRRRKRDEEWDSTFKSEKALSPFSFVFALCPSLCFLPLALFELEPSIPFLFHPTVRPLGYTRVHPWAMDERSGVVVDYSDI